MTNTQNDIAELEKTALGLRRLALKIIFQAGSGHPGGSLSATDLMAALFFGGILRYDSSQPKDPKRDRFLLSKGHASGIYYSVLAKAGFIAEADLDDYRKINSGRFLSGHGHPKTPGIEIASGSLGQGLSVAHGIALGSRLSGFDSKVYVIPREYSGDCGAQIAWTGALTHKKNADIDVKDSWTKQSWRLDSVDVLWRE